ncbi:MAG: PilN domain-containing protein [Parcubacteria group bacterium]|nr:PilN domain-containing protein [Parcubacteria group bacterium]
MPINLLPPDQKEALKWTRIFHIVNYYSFGLGALFIILAAVFYLINFYGNFELKLLEKLLEAEKGGSKWAKIVQQEKEIEKGRTLLSAYEKNQKEIKSILPFLDKISAITPQGVFLTSLSLDVGGQASIAGYSPDRSRVKDIENALKNDPTFQNISSPASNFLKPIDINFKFSFTIKK